MSQQKSKYAVPAVDKCLDILEFLADQPVPKTQAEIAIGLDRNANEIYRVLVGLESRGYLVRENDTGRYQISLKLVNLSRGISPLDQIRRCAIPHMEDLAVELGMSCHLCMLYQSKTMVVVHARSPSPVSLNIAEGSLFSTLNTTSGKVLLANSTIAVRDMILQRESDFTTMSDVQQNNLYQQLADIRSQQVYRANCSFAEGVMDFSTLIGQPEGNVVASLTVSSMNTDDMGKTTAHLVSAKELTSRILVTSNKIAQQLGYI